MEKFYDKYDSFLKIAVYGSAFCKFLVSKSSKFSEDVTERIENFNDISYRVRSCFGLIGMFLDWKALPSNPKLVERTKTGDLRIQWREFIEGIIMSSGIVSNGFDFLSSLLWAMAHVSIPAWLMVPALRSSVTSVVACEAPRLSLGRARETTEWLANVFWALMSGMSFALSIYKMLCALKSGSGAVPEVVDDDESVVSTGTEALECALDLIAGGSGALGFECDATGLGPTLAGCIHLACLRSSLEKVPEELVDSKEFEVSAPPPKELDSPPKEFEISSPPTPSPPLTPKKEREGKHSKVSVGAAIPPGLSMSDEVLR